MILKRNLIMVIVNIVMITTIITKTNTIVIGMPTMMKSEK